MKQIAVIAAAVLSLTLVAPALAQPFADVPTDHWAYDAIAELAAKGLVEGYPDGAFRGDRAMTRYEMAMVVARLLARIEAIKIPPLPPDLVRQAALDKATAAQAAAIKALDTRLTAKLGTVQRLVAEFRAELAALGVRVTAVEEELAAIRARLDNTRVTGDFRVRYNVFPVDSVSGGGTFRHPDPRIRMRVTFTGRVSPDVEAVVRLWAANLAIGATDTRIGNIVPGLVTFDSAYLDVRNYLGARLWRVGRQFYTLTGHGPFGVGLLYDPSNSSGFGQGSGAIFLNGISDGIRSDWVLGPLNITAALYRDGATATAAVGLGAAPGLDHRVVRVTTGALLPGWTLGAAYYEAWQHPTAPAATAGGTGWGADISGSLIPGLSLYLDYASWQSIPTVGAAALSSANAWRVGGNIDLARLAGIETWRPNIDWEFHRFGPLPAGGIAPRYTYATTIVGQLMSFNMEGWLVRLNLTLTPATTAWVLYEAGNRLSDNASYYEYWLRLAHRIKPGTTVTLNYYVGNIGGTDQFNFARAELLYSW